MEEKSKVEQDLLLFTTVALSLISPWRCSVLRLSEQVLSAFSLCELWPRVIFTQHPSSCRNRSGYSSMTGFWMYLSRLVTCTSSLPAWVSARSPAFSFSAQSVPVQVQIRAAGPPCASAPHPHPRIPPHGHVIRDTWLSLHSLLYCEVVQSDAFYAVLIMYFYTFLCLLRVYEQVIRALVTKWWIIECL